MLQARKRLKKLRQERRLSVDAVAALIERSPSSVRAHENGQNGISRQAAALYADAFQVSPSYILWGQEGDEPHSVSASVHEVPVVGELSGNVWVDGYEEKILSTVAVNLPEYKAFELKAFLVGSKSRFYRKGDYVVTAPIEVGVRIQDHVVIRIDDAAGKTKLTLMEVDLGSFGLLFRPLIGGGERIGSRSSWNPQVAKITERVAIVGAVVAYGGKDRPASGPIISQTQLTDVHLLG